MNTTSVVDCILGKYGFGWDLNPYRIVDSKTNRTAYVGKYFDPTEKALLALRASVNRFEASKFKKVS